MNYANKHQLDLEVNSGAKSSQLHLVSFQGGLQQFDGVPDSHAQTAISMEALKNVDLDLLADLLVWEVDEEHVCQKLRLTMSELAGLKLLLN